MKLPRLYGTFGPSTHTAAQIGALIEEGMDGIRLNLSHGSLGESRGWVEALREAEHVTGNLQELLIDLEGRELRLPPMEPVVLGEGAKICLQEVLHFSPDVCDKLCVGMEVLLDDGLVALETIGHGQALVTRGGTVAGRKSIALSGGDGLLPPLSPRDCQNLDKALDFGVTGVFLPFCTSGEDLQSLRKALELRGLSQVKVYAKIESPAGLAALPQMLPLADEIVIARGDLGTYIPLWELPVAQKSIANACKLAKKPFLVVTQMLQSMVHCAVPTRAEVSDIALAVWQGASSLMLTQETALGSYPQEAMAYLRKTAQAAMGEVHEL